MAPHSSTLAWKSPWMEEPGRLQSMGSLSRTWLSDFTFTFHFHALEKQMATHSNVLAWRIPGMAEPGGLLSMGSHRVGHNWCVLAVVAAFFSFTPWIRHHPVRIWKKKMQYYWQFIFIFTGLTYQPNGRSSCHWCSLWYISPLLRGPLIWLLCYGMTPTFTCLCTYSLRIWPLQISRYHPQWPSCPQPVARECLCQEQNDLSHLMQDTVFSFAIRATTEWFLQATMTYTWPYANHYFMQ